MKGGEVILTILFIGMIWYGCKSFFQGFYFDIKKDKEGNKESRFGYSRQQKEPTDRNSDDSEENE